MKINNISLPYPILSVYDDIMPNLGSDALVVKISADKINYYFDFTLNYDNDDIKDLIADKYAEYSCEVDCSSTVLRKSFNTNQNIFRITLPRKSVNGKIIFNTYISVINPIKRYRNRNFNEDYGDATFDMEPGDILACFPQASYNASIRYDKLQCAGSIMIIREGVNEYTDFNFSNSKIEILLPHDLYEIYNSGVGNSNPEIIHASLAYNALTAALYRINDYRNTTWAETILYRIEHEEELAPFTPEEVDGVLQIENPHKLAMTLLKDPFHRMLVSLNNNYKSNESDNG